MKRQLCMALMLCGILAACDDPVEIRGDRSCTDAGRVHSGSDGGTWTRARSPHIVRDSVNASGDLLIEAGALVCVEEGAVIVAGSLTAEGTVDAPIRIEASGTWNGIRVLRNGSLRHVDMRGGSVRSGLGTSVTIEDSHFVRSTHTFHGGGLVMRRVVIDSACHGTTSPSCGAAVRAGGYGSTTLENVVIRDSDTGGIDAGARCALRLTNVLVEGSRGIGISVPFDVSFTCDFTADNVRVTGGHSYPLRISGSYAARWLSGDHYPLITGNARDTVIITEVASASNIHVRKELGVRAMPESCRSAINVIPDREIGTLTMEAGTTFVLGGGCTWRARLVLNGTSDEPVTLRAPQMRFTTAAGDTNIIRHAVLEGVYITADQGVAVVENVRTINSSIELLAAGSRIDGLDATGSAPLMSGFNPTTDTLPAVILGAGTSMRRARIENPRRDGVRVAGNATIRECTVTGSPRRGIHVTAGTLSVQDCNITANGGAGVSNGGGNAVDATNNWWGDVLGPLGPAGDGVEGNVNYTPWRNAPVTWSASPFSRISRR